MKFSTSHLMRAQLGWKGNALSNSKSIADLSLANYSARTPRTPLSSEREYTTRSIHSSTLFSLRHAASSDAVRRSISLSDLAPQRKMFSIPIANNSQANGKAHSAFRAAVFLFRMFNCFPTPLIIISH